MNTNTVPQKANAPGADLASPNGPSQARLAEAVRALHTWQHREDGQGANRHGRCLEAVRAALADVGLSLPPPQPRPHNLALYNYQLLRQDPARWGWTPAPAGARYTLDYFDHVGRLPDGRIAGHIAVGDTVTHALYSSWDYPLTPYWRSMRVASFVPLPHVRLPPRGETGSTPVKPAPKEPPPARPGATLSYRDLEVWDGAGGALQHHEAACVLLASDGHAYVRAASLGESLGLPLEAHYEVDAAHPHGVLILRREAPR